MKPARLATDKGFLIELGRIQRIAVLRMLIDGWKPALQNSALHLGLEEVEMTEPLREGMREALRQGTLSWTASIIVAPGTQSVSGSSGMKLDGLTDIALYFQRIREEYDERGPHAKADRNLPCYARISGVRELSALAYQFSLQRTAAAIKHGAALRVCCAQQRPAGMVWP